MIKVILHDDDVNERGYPYIGKLLTEKCGVKLVLFTEPEKGMVIYNDVDPEHSKVWSYSPSWDEFRFEVFHGSITLNSSS